MTSAGHILQIVPRAPGSRDGVGDYARTLAVRLEKVYGYRTTFVCALQSTATRTEDGFDLLSPLHALGGEQWPKQPWTSIILHYVNYGYHRRGVPFWLPKIVRQLRRSYGGRLVTVFHELYASGSWRQSAFWLRPMQIRIARAISHSSDVCIVSSDVLRGQLQQLAPDAHIIVQPVISNFGEPDLSPDEIGDRDPHRWVICGGTELIERSLRSFLNQARTVSAPFVPRELVVVGGTSKATIRKVLEEQKKIVTQYFPEIDVAAASKILSSCTFGWIDYFERDDVPTAAILKSTAFAACCAHAVIPVLPRADSIIALREDALPGPFFVARSDERLPAESERPVIAQSIYAWYGRNASSIRLAETIASALATSAP